MKSFFKIFFASCLAFVVFILFMVLVVSIMISSFLSPDKPEVKSTSVLVLDLSKQYHEQSTDAITAFLDSRSMSPIPGLYDVIRIINHAKADSSIKGLYIKANANPNGFGTSEELRSAVLDFKENGKFVIAYGEVMSQKAYFVATAADKVYCHPQGGLDWTGLSINFMFVKGLLDKLEIEPQIFYAGKYKSATEPFRVKKMTEPNRAQTTVLLQDINHNILVQTAASRKIDTAQLHRLAAEGAIQTATDAVQARLIDGTLYNDQVQTEILKATGQKETDKINFISIDNYGKARDYRSVKGDKIAVVFAEGEIRDGKSESETVIASENYIRLLRKIRLDKETKAVVLRVNSPGGSALASDGIWREITLLKKEKPVIVSMGDYAASGGYYISCAADSIFAEPGTLTGSIGVFGLLPNLEKFFNDKLGITFDGVKTAPFADLGNVSRPLTEAEKRMVQSGVDTIYHVFKSRVAEGRKMSMEYVDSIAQGHVYTGKRAISIGLVDRTGYLHDAVTAAAAMANSSEYFVQEYPEKKTLFQQLMSSDPAVATRESKLKKSLGEEQYRYLQQLKELREMSRGAQARMIAVPVIY